MNTLFVSITSFCNISCSFCMLDSKKQMIDLEDLLQSEFFKNADIISITGGEPTIHPGLKDLIIQSKTSGKFIHLHTNLIRYSSKLLNFYNRFVDEIHVSLDSVSSPYHDTYRGSQSTTIHNLRNLSSHFQGNICIVMTVSKGNIDQIDSVHDFALELGVSIDYNFLSTDDRTLSLLNMRTQQWTHLLGDIKYKISNTQYLLLKIVMLGGMNRITKCNYLISKKLFVDVDGQMYRCPWNHSLRVGDLKNPGILKDKETSVCCDMFGPQCITFN